MLTQAQCLCGERSLSLSRLLQRPPGQRRAGWGGKGRGGNRLAQASGDRLPHGRQRARAKARSLYRTRGYQLLRVTCHSAPGDPPTFKFLRNSESRTSFRARHAARFEPATFLGRGPQNPEPKKRGPNKTREFPLVVWFGPKNKVKFYWLDSLVQVSIETTGLQTCPGGVFPLEYPPFRDPAKWTFRVSVRSRSWLLSITSRCSPVFRVLIFARYIASTKLESICL